MFLKPNPKQSIIVQDIGKLLLRSLFGLPLAINYGWPTFSSLFKGEIGYPDPLGIGEFLSQALMGSAQFIFALFVVFGFLTRLSCIPIIIGFSVAFFIIHAGDTFHDKELSYLYLSIATCILFLGSGKYSIDHLMSKKPI